MTRRNRRKSKRSRALSQSHTVRAGIKGGDRGATVYVVVENGELYPILYATYEFARNAVTTKYAAKLSLERAEVEEMDDPSDGMVSSVDVDENETGTTRLYIERGINIIIRRYAVP